MTLNLKSVRKHLLAEHNRVRGIHGADDLKKSKELRSSAQKWADQLAATGHLVHSKQAFEGNPLGENVFGAYHSAKTPDEIAQGAISHWYNEVDKFDFSFPENTLQSCGQFTQMVWKSTKQVGFGAARSLDGHVFVVAHYHPAGNYIGHVAENVKPPKGGKRAQFEDKSKPADGLEGIPLHSESRAEVQEESVNGRNVRKTTTTTIEHFADGSLRTTTRTETLTLG